jgi:hypothetical protein
MPKKNVLPPLLWVLSWPGLTYRVSSLTYLALFLGILLDDIRLVVYFRIFTRGLFPERYKLQLKAGVGILKIGWD